MPDVLPTLFAVILDDDRARVKALLSGDPTLAGRGANEERYEARITHWIYAGDTAMHLAAAGYRVEIARMLLSAGADVGAAGNRRGGQPLHYASDGYLDGPAWDAGRQVQIIRLLLEAGADIDAQDRNGATPLHRAVRTRCAAAVRCLLDAGADATARNKAGSTAFHLAVQNTGRGGSGSDVARASQGEIVEAFLARGVRPSMTDANGKSVLDWARSEWIHKILTRNAA